MYDHIMPLTFQICNITDPDFRLVFFYEYLSIQRFFPNLFNRAKQRLLQLYVKALLPDKPERSVMNRGKYHICMVCHKDYFHTAFCLLQPFRNLHSIDSWHINIQKQNMHVLHKCKALQDIISAFKCLYLIGTSLFPCFFFQQQEFPVYDLYILIIVIAYCYL